MKAPVTVAFAGLSLLTSAASLAAAPSPAMSAESPFAARSTLPYQLPPFDRIRDTDYLPGFIAGMAAQRREVDAITQNPAVADFDNTLVALERSGEMLNRVSAAFFNLTSSNTNDALEKIQTEIAPKLAAHRDEIFLDARLFARIETVFSTRDRYRLTAEQARLLERYRALFIRAGVQLDEQQKTEMRAINAEISKLTTQFDQNLLKETVDSAVIVSSAAELEGLTAEEIAAMAAAAKERGLEGQYVIALQNTSGQPVLSRLKNRALRAKIYLASIKRGARGNASDNRAVIARLVELRARRAGLLGYPSHAAYVLDDETARTTDAVNAMLGKLAPAAVANARREAAELQKLLEDDYRDASLLPWDWAYYSEKLRKQKFDFDEEQMKPYFELDSVVRNGVFFAAEKLYGLKFQERKDLPVYHPDVRVYEVFDADGKTLGLFLADFFKRDAKRGGAWMNEFVSQSTLLETKPVVVNNLNIPKPSAGEPCLLTMDEVTTLFHEFGHALHGLFSNVRYPMFSGTNVPRDFVEFPSQINEMWATDPLVLANFAKHYKTKEPIPKRLLAKVEATETFNQGFATTEYLAAALLDQRWYQQPVGKAKVDDVAAFEARALHEAGVDLDAVPPRYRSTYFAHIFGGGYDAAYYAYIWSEVLDADTVEWFKQNGGLTRANGDRFRTELLSRGGSIDAMSLFRGFRGFRGREPDIEPLLRRRGLTSPAAAKP